MILPGAGANGTSSPWPGRSACISRPISGESMSSVSGKCSIQCLVNRSVCHKTATGGRVLRCVMTGGMSPEEFQNYLGLLSRLLRLKTTEREAIAEELRSHLEESLATLAAEGDGRT